MVDTQTGCLLLACIIAVLGFGLALVLLSMTEAVISHAPKAQSGIAAGMLNVSRQVGGVIGVAILGMLVSNQQTFLPGMHLAFVIAGGALLLALVCAGVFVRRREEHPHYDASCTCLRTIPDEKELKMRSLLNVTSSRSEDEQQ